ncbi:xaa-Arg dipeptidase [Hydra vulgaris]|nr:xaa-Arg dipeptidase-like isoform X1 [Hydra vulgaris]XP_047136720.1 xaa-Arg dipeptidase-like isoform X1 [Hydra vulgaris]XP_047136722.1 xaa-Arg dipeptidase-like isoform X1 [Hydra vulgaris]
MESEFKKELKNCVIKTIDSRALDLNGISQCIWEHPELCFQENYAHDLLTTFLEKEKFVVQRKTPLETAFIARYGDATGLKVGVFCEYDALPGLGHGCGHNLIAEVGIATGLALKEIATLYPNLKMEVIVFGTPAEERGGGKILMIEKGVFDETEICMMSHPTPLEIPAPTWLSRIQLTVVFKGKPAHASGAPWEGVNALDAAVSCYNSISMLRQQTKLTSRIHCIIVDGGKVPNIIPERSELIISIRGIVKEDTFDLANKVKQCASGAAAATGCSVTISETQPFYDSVKTNPTMIELYINNAKSIGVKFNDDAMASKLLASTDMGNVSQIKPSIHPCFKIVTPAANHTHEFTTSSGAPENQIHALNSAKSMAMTVVDILLNLSLLEQIRNDFQNKN